MKVRLILAIGIVPVFVMSGRQTAWATEPRSQRVLILHSYNPENVYTKLQENAIRETLAASYSGPIYFRVEFLDLGELQPDSDALKKWREAYLAKYANDSYDLIITTDTPAIEFLTGPARGLLPNSPIVFSGLIQSRADIDRSIRPLTGVTESVDIGETARLSLRLKARANRIVVITDHTIDGLRLRDLAENEIKKLSHCPPVEWIDNLTNKELLSVASKFDPNDLILFLNHYDTTGRRFTDPESLISRICAISKAPVFACYDVYLGTGIVGGKLASGEHQGRAAGELAARILKGERADAIPIVTQSPNRNMFDWRALNRWNISESALPPDHIIRFRQLNFFEKNKWTLLGGMACFVLEAMIIVALLISRKLHLRAERRLQYQNELLQTILEVTPVGVAMFDAEGRITFVNKNIEREAGLDSSCFIGKQIHHFSNEVLDSVGNKLSPDDYPVSQVLRTGKPISNWEGWSKRFNGPLRLRSSSVIPVMDANGQIKSVVAVTQDITDQRENEEFLRRTKQDLEVRVRERTADLLEANRALRQAIRDRHAAELESFRRQDQLAHVQRLATMGEMATGLAHEINSPLAAIVTYTQGCVRRLDSQPLNLDEIRGALVEVSSQAHRAGEIIRRLRAFLRKEKPQNSSVNINEVIRNAVELMQADLKDQPITIRSELADDLPPVQADPIQLEQVAINLIRNAIDAAKSCTLQPNEVVVMTRQGPENQIVIEVADDGPGIAPEYREKIFEPFFTTKKGGLGMGLPISRSIIEAHGGGMEIKSWHESGTMIRITLPIAFAGQDSPRTGSGTEIDITRS